MRLRILVGTVLVTSLLSSCAAEPEEIVPTTVADEVAREVESVAVPAGVETDVVAPDDGPQEVLEAGANSSTSSTPPPTPDDAAAVEAGEGGSAEPTAPVPEATEPAVPEAPASELPEPGGPWIDPRQPDFTKTVPPPQR
ncbi:MAG: hypothetical protein WBO84_13495 [Acidimicrobiia bacterium]|jgi:hypothetical protein